jgi:hypothetical protein
MSQLLHDLDPISRRPLLVLIFWQENTHNQTLARPYFHSAARLLAVENKIVLGDFLSSKINLFSTVFSPEIKKKSSKVITSNVPAGRIGHVVDAGRQHMPRGHQACTLLLGWAN